MNVRLSSNPVHRAARPASQLPGVEQTKPDESGPLAADLPLSGVLLSWPVASQDSLLLAIFGHSTTF
jgi:hypothetical protein